MQMLRVKDFMNFIMVVNMAMPLVTIGTIHTLIETNCMAL